MYTKKEVLGNKLKLETKEITLYDRPDNIPGNTHKQQNLNKFDLSNVKKKLENFHFKILKLLGNNSRSNSPKIELGSLCGFSRV